MYLSRLQAEILEALIFLQSFEQIVLEPKRLKKGLRFVVLGPSSWRLRQVGSESTAEIDPLMTVAAGMVEAWVAMGEKTFLICW